MPKASDPSDRPPDGRQGSRRGGADGDARMSHGADAPEFETRAAEAEAREVERLLRLAAGGDSAAWRAIVSIYAPRVFGILRAQCRDDELAEELAAITYTFQGDKFRICDKEDIRAEIGRSPDKADAAVLTFAYPVAKRSPFDAMRRRQPHDPYAHFERQKRAMHDPYR